jgi:hypothetical protein
LCDTAALAIGYRRKTPVALNLIVHALDAFNPLHHISRVTFTTGFVTSPVRVTLLSAFTVNAIVERIHRESCSTGAALVSLFFPFRLRRNCSLRGVTRNRILTENDIPKTTANAKLKIIFDFIFPFTSILHL